MLTMDKIHSTVLGFEKISQNAAFLCLETFSMLPNILRFRMNSFNNCTRKPFSL